MCLIFIWGCGQGTKLENSNDSLEVEINLAKSLSVNKQDLKLIGFKTFYVSDENERIKGTDTCWGEKNEEADFLFFLQKFLQKRKNDSPEESYTARLISKGINKVAQKVGEEAVELVIEAKDDNEDLFLNEAADLMYHYLVLLIAKGYGLEDVIRVLKERHK